MKNLNLEGAWTAIITPFTKDGAEVDYDALEKLIESQIKGGVTGITAIGTTGESPALEENECEELIKRVKEIINGRCLLMVGSGTNSTAKSVKKTETADRAGADVIMLVNPYYNKPTQEGLYRHFKAVSESTKKPVVLYNIKGRTGVNIETPTLLRLIKDVKNIVGVKEASGDIAQIKEVCQKVPEEFAVLSGDDGLTYTTLKAGGKGVVSVAGNIVPEKISEMVNTGLGGNMKKAKELNEKLSVLFDSLFVETNPIPIKYVAHKVGLCELSYRLPMCEPSKKSQEILNEIIEKYNL